MPSGGCRTRNGNQIRMGPTVEVEGKDDRASILRDNSAQTAATQTSAVEEMIFSSGRKRHRHRPHAERKLEG